MKILALVMTGLLVSCGVVGSPIAPEYVGVAPTIARQKQQHALEEQQREQAETTDPALQGQDEILPPLRPVGTR